MMKVVIQDLRYGLRVLLKRPGFTLVAVITLALGIGANTTIFSFVNAILLRPLPYKNAEQLVVPVSLNPALFSGDSSITYADYLDWKNAGIFAHVAALDLLSEADLTGGNAEPERVRVAAVSEDYFSVMGSGALLGRTFVDDDYSQPGPARALIISYGLWQRRFGSDPSIINQKIYLNGRPYPVVGVMPKDSTWPEDRDVFVPFAVGPNPGPDLLRRDNMIFSGIARLRPDVPEAQVNAVMAGIAQRLEQEFPESRQGWSNRIVGLRDYVVGRQMRSTLLILLAVVGCVLLIACVNVANLLLARAASREREMAIRLALGANRGRLIRQLLTESLLLALVGGGAGFLLAVWGVDLLKSVAPGDTPRLAQVQVDLGVLAFTLAASLATALVCGLIPALQSSRTDLQQALKESSRSATGGKRSQLVRNALVVSEIALSLVLLIGAGLAIRSFMRVQQVDPGLQVERLVTMQLNSPSARYPDQARVIAFYKNLIASVESGPGVESAAASSALPLGGGGFYLGRSFLIEGQPEPPASSDYQAQWNVITPGYFATTGMRLLSGRDFDEHDRADSTKVTIINATLARQMFGDASPLGKRIRSWRDENELREIVGVVEDVRYYGRDDKLRGLVYVPHTQNSWRSMALTVRTHDDPVSAVGAIRGQIAAVDPNLAVANLETMTTILNRSVAPRRASMFLLAAFGGIAALLASIGIYGVLAYTVAQRVQEIGVRIALGAQSGDVLRLVIGQGMKLTLTGVALGLAAAFALTRLMESLLYSTSATDPLTFSAIALMLTLVALLACYVPARRATKVDPLVALRYE
ncbi:MAG TPA: ABC transporter permease [Blastocatellia bacterium]|nr:ABC transporter permease [Blastocatellia bacterium]